MTSMVARAFADDNGDTKKNESDNDPQPTETEYVFEGFKVEFSEKIALTPPLAAKGQAKT